MAQADGRVQRNDEAQLAQEWGDQPQRIHGLGADVKGPHLQGYFDILEQPSPASLD